jgi:segregation and condensation protein B
MMETLAVVAYRQPVSRADVEAVRGVGCGELLRQTMERDLVRIVGRSEELGRPYLYGTTKRFLQLFGLSNTDALPTIQWQAMQDDPLPEDSTYDELSTPKKELVVSTTVVPMFSESEQVVSVPAATVLDQSDPISTNDPAKAVAEDEKDDYFEDGDEDGDDDGDDDDDWDDQDWDDDQDSDSDDEELDEGDDDPDSDSDDGELDDDSDDGELDDDDDSDDPDSGDDDDDDKSEKDEEKRMGQEKTRIWKKAEKSKE